MPDVRRYGEAADAGSAGGRQVRGAPGLPLERSQRAIEAMRRLRAVWRLLRIGVHLLHGVAVVVFRFGMLDVTGRRERIQRWATKLLRVAGVSLESSGRPRPGGVLLVINHISWLDIVVIHALCPQARFVSKADVKHWPVISRLVDAADTLYLERERRRDAMRVVHHMGEALVAGDVVAVFPEGTTGEGHELLPFHANLLQAAIATSTPVQAVALRFSDACDSVSPAVAYVGDTSLIQSLWWVACAEGLRAHVRFLPPQGSAHLERRALAALLREEIAQALAELPAA